MAHLIDLCHSIPHLQSTFKVSCNPVDPIRHPHSNFTRLRRLRPRTLRLCLNYLCNHAEGEYVAIGQRSVATDLSRSQRRPKCRSVHQEKVRLGYNIMRGFANDPLRNTILDPASEPPIPEIENKNIDRESLLALLE